ncbi:MAG TPA: AAA family ATPase [Clostridiales bacterium]|nr:AAA family ATPase [Clostridiales bacterium]
MLKLSLIIADEDKAYIESLVGFLMDKHPHKFQINSFTNRDYLLEFLSKSREKADILLITPDFHDRLKYNTLKSNVLEFNNIESTGLKSDISEYRKPVLIFLSNTKSAFTSGTVDTIYKYQHGDRLVSDIIHIYEKQYKNIEFALKGPDKTKLISVYSPAGGTGKTTIAVNACINCAREEMRVFYVNLETIGSTLCFFEHDYENRPYDNFSSVIFAIKEKDKNLHAKIEGIKFTDTMYDIHYIPPPDSALEMEEILPEEVRYFLNQVRSTGYYNIIFADLSSALSSKNIAVMEESDEIVLIYTPDCISKSKIISFYKEIQLYQKRKGLNLLNKITLILNKYDEHIPQEIKNEIDEVCSIMGITHYIKIPMNNQVLYNQGTYLKGIVEESNSLNKELRKLTGKYTVRGDSDLFQ